MKYCKVLELVGILIFRQFKVLESKGIHPQRLSKCIKEVYKISLVVVDSTSEE